MLYAYCYYSHHKEVRYLIKGEIMFKMKWETWLFKEGACATLNQVGHELKQNTTIAQTIARKA